MALLKDKVAIVTGGAQGIGEAIARKLASEGAAIALVDVNYEKAKATADEIKKLGVDTEAYKADVSNTGEVQEVVDKILDRFKKIDILVNNAGITRDTLLLRMTEQDWDLVISINLKGVFNFTKAVTKIMSKQRNGSIINISSVVGLFGNAGQANYSASKAGVIGLTKTTAKEFAGRNIRANAVAPGFIKTAMTDKLSQEVINKYLENIPMKTLGTPDDVANTVLYLASDLSSYVTGEVIRVDGGLAM